MAADRMVHAREIQWLSSPSPADAAEDDPPTDIYDAYVKAVRELQTMRAQRHVYRAWFGAALDKLHEQYREVERQRRQIAALITENRQLRNVA